MGGSLHTISGYYRSRPSPRFRQSARVSAWCYLTVKNTRTHGVRDDIANYLRKQKYSVFFSSDSIDVYVGQEDELRIEYHNEFIVLFAIDYAERETFVTNDVGKKLIEFIGLNMNGKIISQCNLMFIKPAADILDADLLQHYFSNDQYISSNVFEKAARVWTSFVAGQSSNNIRFLIEDIRLGERRRGRLVQDLVEMIFYKHMAELAFPMAEKLSGELSKLESKLLMLTNKITRAMDTQKQKVLLTELLEISFKMERWQNTTGHRFSATEAYIKLFQDRLTSLDESQVKGYQTLVNFYTKITTPTYRTYQSTNAKLSGVVTRTDRAISLLDTRIRSTVESQNNELLRSSNLQTKQQIVLQETIEAFALVSICYNGNALLQLFLDSLVNQGVDIPVALVTSISIPIICVASYRLMKILKRKNNKKRS